MCGSELRDRPLFLIVVGGATWKAGQREPRRPKYREPAFYLVSAVQQDAGWHLPLPVEQILAWLWQRWELEVAHREMKSGLGVGEMQCWNARSTVLSVQWGAWVYAVLLLAGYRTWGLFGGPSRTERWWPGAKRWSLSTLWRSYRAELWGTAHSRPFGREPLTTGPARWLASRFVQCGGAGAARI